MPASPQDFYKKVGANTVTTLAAPGKNLAATSINVGATTNYPTDTGIVVGIRVVDSNGTIVPGTYTEWNAVVASSTAITIEAVPVYGTDQVYPAGSLTQVFLMVSSSLHNQMVDGLLVSHDQDGKLKAGAISNSNMLANNTVTTPAITDASVTAEKITTPTLWQSAITQKTMTTTEQDAETIALPSTPASRKYRIDVNFVMNNANTLPISDYYVGIKQGSSFGGATLLKEIVIPATGYFANGTASIVFTSTASTATNIYLYGRRASAGGGNMANITHYVIQDIGTA